MAYSLEWITTFITQIVGDLYYECLHNMRRSKQYCTEKKYKEKYFIIFICAIR